MKSVKIIIILKFFVIDTYKKDFRDSETLLFGSVKKTVCRVH